MKKTMSTGFLRRMTCLVLVCVLGSCAGSSPRFTPPGIAYPRQQARDGQIKTLFSNSKIKVLVYPLRGEGYTEMAVRISSQPKQWRKLQQWNHNRKFPQTGVTITVPFEYLNAKYRLMAVNRLYPDDKLTADGWLHKVRFHGETMWFISDVFSGDGENYPVVQKANGKEQGEAIAVGEDILVPYEVLSDEYHGDLPSHPELTFSRGDDGKMYAEYALKRGEALYSAVVVRFTGRVEPNDVNAMAEKIMKLNGFDDPTRIPAGKKIKIPFDDLSDDFASEGAPDRVVNVSRGKNNVYVILDAGHGGADPGTIVGSMTEDEYAYDIVVRTKQELEKRGAKVYLTVSDPNDGLQPRNVSRLINGKGERLNTTPAYHIADTRVSVNLRVYLVNHIYQDLVNRGVDPRQIYLLSIHLDSLHPSMRGAMIYYPYADLRTDQFRTRGSVYGRYAEGRKRVVFNKREHRRTETYSYDFSRELIRELQKNRVPVHSFRPIRPFVYRNNQKWTPGIVRYSNVPTSILLEVVNLSNPHDRRLVQDYRFRDKIATIIAETIF